MRGGDPHHRVARGLVGQEQDGEPHLERDQRNRDPQQRALGFLHGASDGVYIARTRRSQRSRYYQMKPLMRRVLLTAPLAAALLASPSPAAAQPWVVAPASDGADIISHLFWFTLVLPTIA